MTVIDASSMMISTLIKISIESFIASDYLLGQKYRIQKRISRYRHTAIQSASPALLFQSFLILAPTQIQADAP